MFIYLTIHLVTPPYNLSVVFKLIFDITAIEPLKIYAVAVPIGTLFTLSTTRDIVVQFMSFTYASKLETIVINSFAATECDRVNPAKIILVNLLVNAI